MRALGDGRGVQGSWTPSLFGACGTEREGRRLQGVEGIRARGDFGYGHVTAERSSTLTAPSAPFDPSSRGDPARSATGSPSVGMGCGFCAAVSTETCRIPAHPTRLGSPSMRDRGWPSAMNGLSVGFADGSGVSCQSELRSSRPPLEKDKQYAVRGDHLFAARLVCMSRRREALDFCCRR